ncbi:MAG: hypothetical protein L3J69_08775 [Desulfobacula sp.]|nr:hypothetical protein [Desulfobacula sp.]
MNGQMSELDLSVFLNNVGDTAKALEDLKTATKHFEEGLDISRLLLRAFPKTSEYKNIIDHFQNYLKKVLD